MNNNKRCDRHSKSILTFFFFFVTCRRQLLTAIHTQEIVRADKLFVI